MKFACTVTNKKSCAAVKKVAQLKKSRGNLLALAAPYSTHLATMRSDAVCASQTLQNCKITLDCNIF